jgi:hypothetical protein
MYIYTLCWGQPPPARAQACGSPFARICRCELLFHPVGLRFTFRLPFSHMAYSKCNVSCKGNSGTIQPEGLRFSPKAYNSARRPTIRDSPIGLQFIQRTTRTSNMTVGSRSSLQCICAMEQCYQQQLLHYATHELSSSTLPQYTLRATNSQGVLT